jgi:Putative quorum-sensing-regulated virulence factor
VKFPFGKYRGIDVADAPESYLLWLLEWPPLRDPLRTAIELELERREALSSKPPTRINTEIADSIIRAGVRQLSKRRHPDVGGSNEVMSLINQTADRLRELAGLRC